MKKNVVARLGQVGGPLLKLISKQRIAIGYDADSKLVNCRRSDRYEGAGTEILHVCIPYSKKFAVDVALSNNSLNYDHLIHFFMPDDTWISPS